MRKLQLARERDRVAASHADGGRAPLADAIQGQDRGFLERAGKERARRVAFVMIGEHERRAKTVADPPPNDLRLTELLAEPDGHRHRETLEP